MGRRILAAWLAVLLLATSALAAGPETPDPAEDTGAESSEVQNPDQAQEIPQTPAMPENPDLTQGDIPAPEEAAQPEELPAPPEEPSVSEEKPPLFEADPAPFEEEEVTVEETATAELLQEGALDGERTLPNDAVSYAALSLYDVIAAGLASQAETIDIRAYGVQYTAADREFLLNLYARVVNDHPALFYCESGYSFSYNSQNVITTLKPKYNSLSGSSYQTAFQNAVQKALAQVNNSMSDLEKALVLHDYLAVNCRYNWYVGAYLGTPTYDKNKVDRKVYNAYGALVQGDPVCQGYALAYKHLLDLCNIPAVVVTSDAINHAWNLVQIGGEWYHVDITWDDPVPDRPGKSYHDNFLRSDSGITAEGHRGWQDDGYTYPACTDTRYESGTYIFEGNHWQIYWTNRGYYFLRRNPDNYRYETYYSSDLKREICLDYLTNPLNCGLQNYFGIVWLDDCLYYFSKDNKLHVLSLLGYGEVTSSATLSFTQTGSSDGAYSADKDFLGLRYRDGAIEAISSTRPTTVLARFAPYSFPHPQDWDNMTAPAICGLTADGTTVGIQWNANTSAILYVAQYDSAGRQTSVQRIPVTLKSGLNLIPMPKTVSGRCRLMLASANSTPLCAAKTA